jgi:large subunit ribosomal protein L29
MLNIQEIKSLDALAINTKVGELKKEIFNLKFSKSTTGVDKSHKLVELKKDVARLLTVLNSK